MTFTFTYAGAKWFALKDNDIITTEDYYYVTDIDYTSIIGRIPDTYFGKFCKNFNHFHQPYRVCRMGKGKKRIG